MAGHSFPGRLWVALLLMIALAVGALSACTHHTSSEDGPVITRVANPDLPYPLASVHARLWLRAGCLMLGPSVVLWPSSTSWDAKTREVVFGGEFQGAERARVGAMFGGGGGLIDLNDDTSGFLDSDADAALRHCLTKTGTSHVLLAYPAKP